MIATADGRRTPAGDVVQRPLGRRSRRRSRSLVALAAAGIALIACGSANAASHPRAPRAPQSPTPSYLFSIPTSSGSLTGSNDRRLTLRLTDSRSYLTRFTDRPLRQAFVVANTDFARRFKGYYSGSAPNAVLSYTRPGATIPDSIVLTIRNPRWNAQRHTWTFTATRIRTQPDNLPDSTVRIAPPSIPNPRSFTQATLMIDDASPCSEGLDHQGENCAYANFTNANLTGANFAGANLSGATLQGTFFNGGASFAKANLSGANLDWASLNGTDLSGANLTGAQFIYAQAVGANFAGANLAGADMGLSDLDRANLTGANLTGAYLGGAEIRGSNLTGATLDPGALEGSFLCNTTLPSGANSGC